jgi:hypothetical protein
MCLLKVANDDMDDRAAFSWHLIPCIMLLLLGESVHHRYCYNKVHFENDSPNTHFFCGQKKSEKRVEFLFLIFFCHNPSRLEISIEKLQRLVNDSQAITGLIIRSIYGRIKNT